MMSRRVLPTCMFCVLCCFVRIYFRDRHSDYEDGTKHSGVFWALRPVYYLQGRTQLSPLSLVQRAVTRFRRGGCATAPLPAESLRHSYSELAKRSVFFLWALSLQF